MKMTRWKRGCQLQGGDGQQVERQTLRGKGKEWKDRGEGGKPPQKEQNSLQNTI